MAQQVTPVGIMGTGIRVPERVLTNEDLERMVDTSDEWIRTRTGIRERHIAAENEAASDLAIGAARRALEDARVSPEELDLIIVATNSPDMLFPATACLVQDALGAGRAGAFDLQAGCTGFLYALACGGQFVATGTAKRVLVIGAEVLSPLINWQDRNTCVLFGDGAGAVVLGPVPEGYGILATRLGSEGRGAPLISLPGGLSRHPASAETLAGNQHFIHMNGREVFKFAVKVMIDGCLEILQAAGLAADQLDCLIPHQANIRIIEAAAKRLELPMDRVWVNVDRYGNTSAASIPLALHEALTAGRIKNGDNVVMVAFGAGLTWGAMALRWYDRCVR
ncbi:beta-ketoacyl-ACP synthase III [Desulfofundulus thermobenzoicus]|uniref:Beta-ketoacyl-[acyl-carrier-protein] synthase III n=1 Tax=Desulfofundulus thermobenzoicus TaxID=29376 RepID=A0A6N7IQA1_9FIRM|nr:beta-ketoacyl-ACP synthase III [Desulfofundulus thermobenzoicus]MQL51739.1 beta-ketoacyl-ACP synthase III [Desulfofundulus thermobenzoicus]HHW44977.1 ketoacyl-ACP synthase III [Desulfotomaculum sp.]